MRYRKLVRFVTKPLTQARHTPKSAPARLELALLDTHALGVLAVLASVMACIASFAD